MSTIKSKWLVEMNGTTGILCDCNILLTLKEIFYQTTISSVLLYDTECWAIKRRHSQNMSI